MMQKIKLSSLLWIVLPKKKTQKQIDLHSVDINLLANSKKEAWDKKYISAEDNPNYEDAGWEAIEVNIFIREVK